MKYLEVAAKNLKLATKDLKVAVDGSHLATKNLKVTNDGKHLAVKDLKVTIDGSHLAKKDLMVTIDGSHLAVKDLMVTIDGNHLAAKDLKVTTKNSEFKRFSSFPSARGRQVCERILRALRARILFGYTPQKCGVNSISKETRSYTKWFSSCFSARSRQVSERISSCPFMQEFFVLFVTESFYYTKVHEGDTKLHEASFFVPGFFLVTRNGDPFVTKNLIMI